MKKLLMPILMLMLCMNARAQLMSIEGYQLSETKTDSCYIAGEIKFKFPYLVNQADDSGFTIVPLRIPSVYPELTETYLKAHFMQGCPALWGKLCMEHLIIVRDSNVVLNIDPALDFRIGAEDGNMLYKNTRGFILNGYIGKSLFVRSEFYETQTTLPEYAAAWVDTMKFIPGMIRMKPFGTNGFDYGVAFSQIMWQPFRGYGMRLGYDRFHIGKGYRSMILSDASQAYPFLMNTFTRDKWSLSHNIASLHNPDFNNRLSIPLSESGVYQQKWFSFTYLTYSPKSWLNLGLFESVIFMPADSTGISFYPMSMLPVPLVRTFAVESQGLHHAMVGLLADATWKKQLVFYTQIVADKIDFSKLKHQQGIQGALQLGLRFSKANSFLFSEFNLATNNAYTSSHAWTSYTSNDQPLAHPTGQQFKEFVAGAHWQRHQFFADVMFNYIWAGALPVTDNYLRADNYTNVLLSGFYEPINRPDRVMHLGCTVSYYINPVTNFVVFAGLHYRNFQSTLSVTPENSLTYEIGIRHMIRKQYYDFF